MKSKQVIILRKDLNMRKGKMGSTRISCIYESNSRFDEIRNVNDINIRLLR